MKLKYELGLALGVLVLGISADAVVGQAASRKCSSEECACEKALAKNTVEALEALLKKYPYIDRGTTACAALAVPSGDGVGPSEDHSHDESDSPNGRVSTPSEG